VPSNNRKARNGSGCNSRQVQVSHGRLIAEAPESGANAGQRSPERLHGTNSTFARELSTERDPDFVQALAAPVLGQRVDSEPDQLFVAALGEFDRAQLGSHPIGLGRPSRSWTGSSRSPLEGSNEETRFGEPLESAPCDVAMNLLGGSHLVRRHRQFLRTGE
jgi:hypothetical protein